MSKNRPVPPGVLARLHGKGSMSEILNIERERLRQQSEQAMQRQLGTDVATDIGTHRQTEVVRVAPTHQPTALTASMFEQSLSVNPTVGPTGRPDDQPTYLPTPTATAARRVSEGLSRRSRFVGESLPDMNNLIIHVDLDLDVLPALASEIDLFYRQHVFAGLPFSSQRDLLLTICRLTSGFHKAACQITLAQLARASGIRNVKTLRKWLNDLSERGLIRYTPIHGDPRGPIIALLEPEGLTFR